MNLQSEKGKYLLKELVDHSDVLVTNLIPGAVRNLGIDYESLIKINIGLVYASITAYGQYGPFAEKPDFDCVIQAHSGHMFITGFEYCASTKAGSAFTGYGSGLYCVIGILLALRHRDETGQGQEIDISMLDARVSFLETVFTQ